MLTTSISLSSASMRAARTGRSSTPFDHQRERNCHCAKTRSFRRNCESRNLGQGRDEGGTILFVAQLDPQHDLVVGMRAKQCDPGGVRPAAGQPLEHRDKDLPDVRIPVVPRFIEEACYSAHVISLGKLCILAVYARHGKRFLGRVDFARMDLT